MVLSFSPYLRQIFKKKKKKILFFDGCLKKQKENALKFERHQ